MSLNPILYIATMDQLEEAKCYANDNWGDPVHAHLENQFEIVLYDYSLINKICEEIDYSDLKDVLYLTLGVIEFCDDLIPETVEKLIELAKDEEQVVFVFWE